MTIPSSHIPLHKYLPTNELREKINFHVLNTPSDYDTTEAHRHGYHELFFFNDGGGTHIIDFEENTIHSRSIHLVSSGQVHQLKRMPACQGSFLTFSHFTLASYLTENKIREYSFLDSINKTKPLQVAPAEYKKICEYAQNIQEEKNENIKFSWLLLILNLMNETTQNTAENDPGKQDEHIVLFCTLLSQNFHLYHSPHFYAERLCISEKQLNSKVKNSYGITVSEMISNRLLLEAKRLIMHSSVSIKEISFDLGFNDPAYFSRFIKKNLKKSPSELRNGK